MPGSNKSSETILINIGLKHRQIKSILDLSDNDYAEIKTNGDAYKKALKRIVALRGVDLKKVSVTVDLLKKIASEFKGEGISKMTKQPLIRLITCMAEYELTGKKQVFNKNDDSSSSGKSAKKRYDDEDSAAESNGSDSERDSDKVIPVEPLNNKKITDYIRQVRKNDGLKVFTSNEFAQYIEMYCIVVAKGDKTHQQTAKLIVYFVMDAINDVKERGVKDVEIDKLRQIAMYYRPSIDIGKSNDRKQLIRIIQYGADDETSKVAFNKKRADIDVGSSNPLSYSLDTLRSLANDENKRIDARNEKNKKDTKIDIIETGSKISGARLIKRLAEGSITEYEASPLLWEVDTKDLESEAYFDYPYTISADKIRNKKSSDDKIDKRNGKKRVDNVSTKHTESKNKKNNVKSDVSSDNETQNDEPTPPKRVPKAKVETKKHEKTKELSSIEIIYEFGKKRDFSEKAVRKFFSDNNKIRKEIGSNDVFEDMSADLAFYYFGRVIQRAFKAAKLDTKFYNKFMGNDAITIKDNEADILAKMFANIIPKIDSSNSNTSRRTKYVNVLINGFREKHVNDGASIDINICSCKDLLNDMAFFDEHEIASDSDIFGSGNDSDTDAPKKRSSNRPVAESKPAANVKPIANVKPAASELVIGDTMSSDESESEFELAAKVIRQARNHLLCFEDKNTYVYFKVNFDKKEYTYYLVERGIVRSLDAVSFEQIDDVIASEIEDGAIEIVYNLENNRAEWDAVLSFIDNNKIVGVTLSEIPQRTINALSVSRSNASDIIPPSKKPRPADQIELLPIVDLDAIAEQHDEVAGTLDIISDVGVIEHDGIEVFFIDTLTKKRYIYSIVKDTVYDESDMEANEHITTLADWNRYTIEKWTDINDLTNTARGKRYLEVCKQYFLKHLQAKSVDSVSLPERSNTSGSESDVSPRNVSQLRKTRSQDIVAK